MKDTKVLQFVDTTLLNQSINDSAKAEIAILLEQAGIDIIEIPSEEASFTNTVVSDIQNAVVAVSCIPSQQAIDEAREIIERAKNPSIRLKINADVYKQVDLSQKQDKEDLLKLVKDSIAYCKKITDNVELVIGLSSRLHKVFIYKIIETAAEADIKVVTISDEQLPLLPHEIDELFADIVYNLPDYPELLLGIRSVSKLGVATANAMAATRNGARQLDIRPVVTPACDDNAILKHIINILHTGKKDLKFETRLNLEVLKAVNKKIKESLCH